jgi:WD40 repeat protein
VWQLADGQLLPFQLPPYYRRRWGIALSPDGGVLAAGVDDVIRLWDFPQGRERLRFPAHEAPVKSVAYSPDGCYIATGSADSTGRLWDATTGEPLVYFEVAKDGPNSVAFAPDGRTVATGDAKGIRLWSVPLGKEIRHCPVDWRGITALTFSRDGKTILSAGGDGTLRLWDVTTGGELRQKTFPQERVPSPAPRDPGTPMRFNLFPARIWDLTLSGNGEQLFLTVNGEARRMNLRTWEDEKIEGPQPGGFAMAVSPDGNWLAVGGVGVELWDLASGTKYHLPAEGNWHKQRLAFSPDAQHLALVDGTILHLWDVATQSELGRQVYDSTLTCLAFSPRGTELAVGSEGTDVVVWDVTRWKPGK